LERAAELLRETGIGAVLLHGGTSTVVALGTPPGYPEGWPIALQHPLRPDASLGTVSLRDAALSVSAVHGKSFRAAGRRFGHVLDPCSGRPVENTLLAAVVTPSATDADALSTALLVLGADGIGRLRERFPDADLLVAVEERTAPEGTRVVTSGGAWGVPGERSPD
jgi:thiamine biosynthesis lipoprotein